jgi:hypothetical protein
MEPDQLAVTRTYLEHLSPHDLALVCSDEVTRLGVPATRALLAANPDRLDRALGAETLFRTVFSHTSHEEPLLSASPFLVFAVCVERAAVELATATYVAEWLGPGRRAPVFDVAQLLEFLAPRRRRLFLAELLASYTHVRSGSVVQFTRRGLRRHRFSELDPVRLASLLEVISEAERPGLLRRLGDLALFLTGVFPDAVSRRGFGPVEESRLRRAGRLAAGAVGAAPTWTREATEPVRLLSQLGPRWYRAAFQLMPRPVPADLVVVGELPERFSHARRVLSFITERFLFPHRESWFGLAAG